LQVVFQAMTAPGARRREVSLAVPDAASDERVDERDEQSCEEQVRRGLGALSHGA